MSTSGDRIEDLSARLERIEAFLATMGFAAPSKPPPLPVTPPEPVATPVAPTSVPAWMARLEEQKQAARQEAVVVVVAPSDGEPLPAEVIPEAIAAEPVAAESIAAQPPRAVEPPLVLPMARPMPRPVGPQPSPDFEHAIGLKVAGWIGAIVVVIGGAMGVKFAYDQGWLGGLPNEVRLGLLYAVGLSIIGVGEYVHRRVAPLAAVGIFGAGVAMLFVVGYAGNAYYGLYAQQTAFALMAGACAIGFLIAWRGRLVSIGVLSLLGANLAPVILRQTNTGELSLLVYVLVLQVLALTLAHIGREERWWTLRILSLATTSLWVAARLLQHDTMHSPNTALFAAVYAALFHVENTLAAWRRGPQQASTTRTGLAAGFSMLVMAGVAVALLVGSSDWPSSSQASLVVSLAAIAEVVALGGLRLRSRSDELNAILTSWHVQAAVLLLVAMPIALGGVWLVVAWAVLGLAYAVLAYFLRKPWLAAMGLGAWTFAAAWFCLKLVEPRQAPAFFATIGHVGEVPLAAWFGIAIVLALVGHATAFFATSYRIAGRSRDARSFGQLVAAASSIGAAVAIYYALPGLAATGTLVAVGWLLFGAAFALRRDSLRWHAVALLGLTAAKWVVLDVIEQRLASDWSTQHVSPIFNATMAVGVVAVGSLAAILSLAARRLERGTIDDGRLQVGVASLTIVLLSIGMSVEIDRSVMLSGSRAWPPGQLVQMGWTVLWLFAVLILVPIVRWLKLIARDRRSVEVGVATLVGLLAIKFLVVDSLWFRLASPHVTAFPLINAQTLVAAIVIVGLVVARRIAGAGQAGSFVRALIPLVPLVIGSIELDRIVAPGQTLVALSIFWGLYAVATITAGFALRTKSFRVGGLALLGLTLAKVVLLDLAQAPTGWRILSFLAVGAILLLTSVLYGKLSPLLLKPISAAEPLSWDPTVNECTREGSNL